MAIALGLWAIDFDYATGVCTCLVEEMRDGAFCFCVLRAMRRNDTAML